MSLLKDPLGLSALESAVAELCAAVAQRPPAAEAAWPELVGTLDAAHTAFALKMDLLRDRYRLLKQSSAQLADEVAWLRDQLDDLASADDDAGETDAAPIPDTAAKPGSAAGDASSSERRRTDSWKGSRP